MKMSFAEGVARAIHDALAADPAVVLIGNSFMGLNAKNVKLMDPVARDYPERVLVTPVSELALAGAGIGAAMCGQRPVVDFGTGSFMLQALAQVANEAANVSYMSGGQSRAPVTFYCRAGIRGSGAPQHSHRFQAMLGQVPGLQILAPGTAEDAYDLLKWAMLESRNPSVFLSHLGIFDDISEVDPAVPGLAPGKAKIRREGSDLTIIASSITVPRSLAAAEGLAREHGVDAEVVDLRTIAPLDREGVLRSVAKTGRVVIADECHRSFGVSAEIAALLLEDGFGYLKAPVKRVAVPDVPIPFSPGLEAEVVVTAGKILAAGLQVLENRAA